MASAFRPVNSPLTTEVKKEDLMATTPTTPRPSTAPQPLGSSRSTEDVTTPTRSSFGNAMASQKQLPSSPFPEGVHVPEITDEKSIPKRVNSQQSRKSGDSMDMDESDGEGHVAAGEDGAASDDDSVNADGSRSKSKKKQQRFFCKDFPPCNLSFTRSEHLARHIRKHTGERPFQCHCSRRFSRLDNLRQHAQTVHVNEDIPIDSPAAGGTRFQRQIRTERVRPAGGRARASTAGSAGNGVRGHSKSLSTSSITSIGSVGSSFGGRDDVRRRPPPLVMADQRSRLSLESYRSGPDGQFSYRPVSPSDFGTPTSATFSTGQSSPRWGSGVASPTSSHSRSHSMYTTGGRTPGRRLSVPSSGGNPFQSPHGANSLGRPLFGPVTGANNTHPAPFSPAGSSVLGSPTTSTSGWSRRDSITSEEEAWRRRTWHPDSSNFQSASRLSNVLTPSQFSASPARPPISNPSTQVPALRLPGIESFDAPRPVTPPRRNPSPMMIDSDAPHPPALLPGSDHVSEDRRNTAVWDMGLHRGLTRLEIASNTPPRDGAGAWANEVNRAVQAQAEQVRLNPPTVRFENVEQTATPTRYHTSHAAAERARHQHTISAPHMSTPRENKRHGWYHGPVMVHSPSEARGPTVDRMIHPNLANGFSGFPAREQQQLPSQQPSPNSSRQSNSDPLRRLEALVAVATSEGSTAAAY